MSSLVLVSDDRRMSSVEVASGPEVIGRWTKVREGDIRTEVSLRDR